MKNKMKKICLDNHSVVVFLVNTACCMLAYLGAFALRFDFGYVPESHRMALWIGLPFLLLIRLVVLVLFRAHRGLYRYVSLPDFVRLFQAVSVGSLLFAFGWLLTFNSRYFMPRSIYLIEWLLCLALLVGVRVVVRLWRNSKDHARKIAVKAVGRRALIVGAGNLGENALRMVDRRFVGNDYDVQGFLDCSSLKQGTFIHGVPVLGCAKQVADLVRTHEIDTIIFAITAPPAGLFQDIITRCDGLGVTFNVVSVLRDVATGAVSVDRMRSVRIEDLLGRPPVRVDSAAVSADLKDRTVLVTGAGGSIGSELCRQIAAMKPRCIVLFESGETPLFEIDRELRRSFPQLDVQPFIGDVKHRDVVDRAFKLFQPDYVYHAAAYKHVPLMEAHPDEAVLNNVRGTRNLAEAARQFRCKRFVMISTDKAVRPTNVMGATKRMCELVIQSMNGGDTVFAAVRFGNVLGSNGSVIPIFKKQIEQGGPLTITHPDMTRYFMMIPEAVALVLQCGVIAEPSDVFVLDMGTPVKIMDLAQNMIRLSGLRENVDISIEVTGLRPGEKMYEELVAYGEALQPAAVPKVNVLKQTGHCIAAEVLAAMIRRLEELALTRDPERVRLLLWRLIDSDNQQLRDGVEGFSARNMHQLIADWADSIGILPPVPADKGTVLAVLGDPALAGVLADVVACVGYKFEFVRSREQALQKIAKKKYAAILCDYVMPEGVVFQDDLHDLKIDAPLVAMSLYDSQRFDALLEYEHDFPVLKKPFLPSDFESALAQG